MKEAKPLKIWARPEDNWSNEYNQFDAYGIQFDGAGDEGVFSVVKGNNPKFKIGESAHYTVEDKGKHHDKITFKDPQYEVNTGSQGGEPFGPPVSFDKMVANRFPALADRERLIIRQCCIKATAQYCSQRENAGGWIPVADAMFDWVMKPESVEAKEIVNDVLSQDFKAAVEADEDKFPF